MDVKEMSGPLDDKFHISADTVNLDDNLHVLNHSNTFAIFDRWGNISSRGNMVQGIYHEGTRFINQLVLNINGKRPLLLSSTIKEENDILSVDLTNAFLSDYNIPENTVHLSRNQFIREWAYYEEIKCVNYSGQDCNIALTLLFSGDFKDIFEIRGINRLVRPNQVQVDRNNDLSLTYEGLDGLERQAIIQFDSQAAYVFEGTEAQFTIDLIPGEPIYIRYNINFLIGDQPERVMNYEAAKNSTEKELQNSRFLFAKIQTSNEQFDHWIARSTVDLLSLLAETDEGKYPYAGVPWYNAPFGRDGLITAMQTLWLAPEISKDVLLFLAANQATALVPEKDAEPGKILHEARHSEMANTGEVPFKQYYGTIDATPLFVMLAGMYYERTADEELIRRIWPNIKAALKWIDVYGDVDGDGFVEYQYKAKNGLTNQGWKDSFDAIMNEDGSLAESPIALCEVQGYVYAAKRYAGKLARKVMDEHDFSEKLLKAAATLKKNFNIRFWDSKLGCYVLALDGKKRPCKVITSNGGHCLFTQIADHDKAAKLAETLMSNEMFSGWGIRTLSSKELKYNPMSYHNGSIWPHDNALIAYGLSLYGLQQPVLKIMSAVFEASLFIDLQRMPELYCGFDKRRGEGPTAYPVACSPQAWSVAVVFMLLQACLRIEINALTKTITFNKPELPAYLETVSIENLRLDGSTCNLRLNRLPSDVGFNLIDKPKDWQVIIIK